MKKTKISFTKNEEKAQSNDSGYNEDQMNNKREKATEKEPWVLWEIMRARHENSLAFVDYSNQIKKIIT